MALRRARIMESTTLLPILSDNEVISRVDELLEARYWREDNDLFSEVLAETVHVLLARQTRQAVSKQVFRNLRQRYPTWERLARARAATIERVIRPAGLGCQRSMQLRSLLHEVRKANRELGIGPYGTGGGDLTLEFLRDWSEDSARAYLETLPGIGPDSAQRIRSSMCGEDYSEVDKHARRVLRRLGVLGRNSDYQEMDYAVSDDTRVRLHSNLARHGRASCLKSGPQCESCVLVSFCNSGRSRVAASGEEEVVLDLFGGAGAMGLGFEKAGFRIAAAVEIERRAAQTYRLNHPGVPVLEADVEEISGDLLRTWLPGLVAPAAVIAGPPCQGYSVAGARTGDDRRNLLFRHVSRLARELAARSVLIENVPGVRRVNGVSYTDQITNSLRDAGYLTWDQPADLRASEFGVAQNRRRLFFVGVAPEVGLPRVPTPTHCPHGEEDEHCRLPRTPALSKCLEDLPNLKPGGGGERLHLADGRVVFNSTAMNHSPEVVAKIRAIGPGGGPISNRRLYGDVANTLVAGHRALPVHPTQHRTITVREAARIQGFPDNYFFCGPRAAQPLQVANAVPPGLAEAVAIELRTELTNSRVGNK
ncbi:MAG: DNA (cytosine-5-)-methyltransferase [Acidimicrobiia bacterium]|nr:DNA (cytosine-5-)-methyltransferase [Acidimicrobiia bacterium]